MIYFVTANRADEIYVIQKQKPKALLVSYWYFKRINLTGWVEALGYQPKILLDSGAWSAHNAGAEINLMAYAAYIQKHEAVIDEYINLDVIGNTRETWINQLALEALELNPIPVFHYGDQEAHLEEINRVYPRIALGGTVPIKNKEIVAAWVKRITMNYPENSFHVLGTNSKVVRAAAPACTYDATSWIMMAANGFPHSIPGKTKEAKRERMEYWIKELEA